MTIIFLKSKNIYKFTNFSPENIIKGKTKIKRIISEDILVSN